MNSSSKNRNLIINQLIDFFYHISGNRSMPNLFPNVFNVEKLKEYNNKTKQLTYLFKIYDENDNIESLLNILIKNITWNEELDKKINEVIKNLNLDCQDGVVKKICEIDLTFGEFTKISEEIHKDPDNREQIVKKYDISLQDFNEVEESFKSITKDFGDVIKTLTPVLNSIEFTKPVFDLTNFMAPITEMMKSIEPSLQLGRLFTDLRPILPNIPVYSTFTHSTNHLVEDPSPGEKVMIYELCPITRNNCSLHHVDISDLEQKRPYVFLIYPSAHNDLVEITKDVLDEYEINLITAVAEPFIGGKYCKICSFIKYCDFCIAELGELNLNVFMEIGLAFGFDKFTILTLNENYTSQNKIPFDLDSFMNIPYKTNDELKINLKSHVEKIIRYIDLS